MMTFVKRKIKKNQTIHLLKIYKYSLVRKE